MQDGSIVVDVVCGSEAFELRLSAAMVKLALEDFLDKAIRGYLDRMEANSDED